MQGAAVWTRQNRSDGNGHPPIASWRRLTATLALVVLAASGCAGSDSADDPGPTTQPAPTAVVDPTTARDAITDGAKVIDVRTPEEFAAGHLRGAVNADVSAPDFAERIAGLDKTARYVVYCASGNRAGTAIETMRGLGFEDLINGGGYEDLAALGLPTA
jgi:rhodanese-related sulfurtransferase